ncbi:MAG TPA: glycosyltransferase family 4 protein [Candidatus Limnocylindria bacterium]|nr:glycosyltransferase family 4 protein [Candidatus Limnocylindria bacterium]
MSPSADYPRRVRIVTQYFWPEPGAPSVRYAAIVRTLVSLGVDVTVLTGIPSYPTGRVAPGYAALRPMTEEHDGARIQRLPLLPYGGQNKWLRLANHGSFATSVLLSAMRAHPVDLVITESPPLPLALGGAAIARRGRAPMVLYVADAWPDVAIAMGALREGWLADRLRSLESAAYRAAWRITVPTDGLYAKIAAHPAGGAAKTLLLPNGVDHGIFHPVDPAECGEERAALGDLADRALFIYAGTIGHAQALDTILDCAILLRDQPEIGFALLGDGPERARLEARASAAGLGNVRFLGAVPPEQVARYLALARASIAPLRDVALFEATRPAKILPSLACARPVVFCGRGEMAALLERERAGLVVPPEDATALAAAVRSLAAAPAEARAMGERGRAWALREFDFTALVRRWFESLSAALPRRARGS